jgi:hypothetical protein
LIIVLPKGIKFNANHHVTDIFIPLLESRKTEVRGNDQKSTNWNEINTLFQGTEKALKSFPIGIDELERDQGTVS